MLASGRLLDLTALKSCPGSSLCCHQSCVQHQLAGVSHISTQEHLLCVAFVDEKPVVSGAHSQQADLCCFEFGWGGMPGIEGDIRLLLVSPHRHVNLVLDECITFSFRLSNQEPFPLARDIPPLISHPLQTPCTLDCMFHLTFLFWVVIWSP